MKSSLEGCIVSINENNSFSNWNGFGKLWEWTEKQEWFKDFWATIKDTKQQYINPDRFANAMYEFLKEMFKYE